MAEPSGFITEDEKQRKQMNETSINKVYFRIN